MEFEPHLYVTCASIHTFKHVYLRDQQADRNKLYENHHCGGGLPASGFNAGRIRILVSMATDKSPRL